MKFCFKLSLFFVMLLSMVSVTNAQTGNLYKRFVYIETDDTFTTAQAAEDAYDFKVGVAAGDVEDDADDMGHYYSSLSNENGPYLSAGTIPTEFKCEGWVDFEIYDNYSAGSQGLPGRPWSNWITDSAPQAGGSDFYVQGWITCAPGDMDDIHAAWITEMQANGQWDVLESRSQRHKTRMAIELKLGDVMGSSSFDGFDLQPEWTNPNKIVPWVQTDRYKNWNYWVRYWGLNN